MSSKNKNIQHFLIHCALFDEAKPIIDYFGLRQLQSVPYKVFSAHSIVLVVSGTGKENTANALDYILKDGRYNIKAAINTGIAGCSDKSIPPGSVFTAGCLGVDNIPSLVKTADKLSESGGIEKINVVTLSKPAAGTPPLPGGYNETFLVDMEAWHFYKKMSFAAGRQNVFIVKIVSDYFSDRIPSASQIQSLISDTFKHWEFLADEYFNKLESVRNNQAYKNLPEKEKYFIDSNAWKYRLSFQELKQIAEADADIIMWGELPLSGYFENSKKLKKIKSRKEFFHAVYSYAEELKNKLKLYEGFKGSTDTGAGKINRIKKIDKDMPGFGKCPVASDKTRCCNLLTLDAVEGCGFDCSYCSIRYFYGSEAAGIDYGFSEKLKKIKLDPDKTYHIGTGQSSDSLMWGNRAGIMDALFSFARGNTNVILEFKSKSDNIKYLKEHDIPENIITTWSLNPQVIVENEEHYTASLERRLNAAKQISDKGNLVGFHFHPMVYYGGWKKDYGEIFRFLLENFNPENVAMVSLGTLTFIKPVIKNMRTRIMKSKILQMPLADAEGKYSYPYEIKKELFSFAYNSLKMWHGKVFFYMCMEDISLWPDVFGYSYNNNDDFETAMINAYKRKVDEKRGINRNYGGNRAGGSRSS